MKNYIKHILFITGSLAHNGTETFIMNVYRHLDKNKFQADFLLNCDIQSDYRREAIRNRSNIYIVTSRRKNPLKYYCELNNFFRNHKDKYQAVHYCCGSLTSIAPIYYAKKYNIPVRIIHAHNSDCHGWHNKTLHYLLKPYATKFATDLLACSISASKFFSEKKPYKVINNGIEISHFSYDLNKRKKIRNFFKFDENCIVLGNVGRFVEVKNHTFLIDIFAEFLKIHPSSVLVLIGIGELKNDIRKKVEIMGLTDRVIFLGQRNYVADIMQAMDVFIMPSLFEGLPFVLVEAQASGLPCLISDVIDQKVDITGNIVFQSLSKSPKIWAENINQLLHSFVRSKTDKLIDDAGYSVDSTTKIIENIYLKK